MSLEQALKENTEALKHLTSLLEDGVVPGFAKSKTSTVEVEGAGPSAKGSGFSHQEIEDVVEKPKRTRRTKVEIEAELNVKAPAAKPAAPAKKADTALFDQIKEAVVELVGQERQPEILNIFSKYGVKRATELKESDWAQAAADLDAALSNRSEDVSSFV